MLNLSRQTFYLPLLGGLAALAGLLNFDFIQLPPLPSAVSNSVPTPTPADERRVEALTQVPAPGQPLTVAIAIDKSGSAPQHGIQANSEAITPLFELFEDRGGELAVFTICNGGNEPSARVRIAEPPPPPALNPFVDPESIHEDNPIRRLDQERERQAARKHHEAETARLLLEHQTAVAARQAEASAAIAAFQKDQLAPLLNRQPDCQESDVYGAMARMKLFLSEDAASWSAPPKPYALFLSDGLDTVGKPPVDLPGVDVVLVNGSGERGVFSQIPHKAFESVEGAIAYIRATAIQP